MNSLWSDDVAADYVRRYAEKGVAEDLALRVYSSRLLGAEPRLVQHGGGNTSLKTTARDVTGEPVEVLRVKGSGWDLEFIEPEGLPAVRMAPLMALRRLRTLSDEAMVDAQRGALMDSTAPNPSVETLLHAWIPHRVVDHTHANAVLALCDQPNGEAMCHEVYGDRLAVTPYCMPGFSLAQLAAAVFEANPKAEGMVLLKHGLFSWGDTARQSYERMIAFVSMAEARLGRSGRRRPAQAPLPADLPSAAEVAPVIRGALAEAIGGGRFRRVVLEHRTSEAVLAFAGADAAPRFSQAGLITPDHVIRIKPWPLLLPPPGPGYDRTVRQAVAGYADRYRAYFTRHNARADPKKTMLDPWPRWVLVPGIGLFGAGVSAKEARITADIAETTVGAVLDAEALGRFESISEADTFDMEYWSLEQAKVGKVKPKPLAGQVAVVTGGAGGIGAAIGAAFAAEGAEVAVLDRDGAAAEVTARSVKGLGLACDVTDPAQVDAAMTHVVAVYGGVDIVVLNAGAAYSGRMIEVDDAVLRQSFELNFFAHQTVARAAVRVMLEQKTGGALLFNVSKQALNPGPDFGPYGLAKAAMMALMRQYALEHGADGIRSNAVNADRIRSGLLDDAMVAARSQARGVSEADYMAGNLLGREVTAVDVAQAFVTLALAEKTTGAVLTVDGGNMAAAVR